MEVKPLVFEFKCKVKDNGDFKMPDLGLRHCTGLYNETTIRVAYRKRKNQGYALPDQKMNINGLPDSVEIIGGNGFMKSFRVTV